MLIPAPGEPLWATQDAVSIDSGPEYRPIANHLHWLQTRAHAGIPAVTATNPTRTRQRARKARGPGEEACSRYQEVCPGWPDGTACSLVFNSRNLPTGISLTLPSCMCQNACKVMAKDLVRTRRYVSKFYAMRTQLQAVSLRLQSVRSNTQMAEAMKGATTVRHLFHLLICPGNLLTSSGHVHSRP